MKNARPQPRTPTARLVLAAALVALVAAGTARGQIVSDLIDQERINLRLFVNYGAAYREGSWVPIDVIVDNQDADVVGRLELRTYSGSDSLQSPIYQVPVDSPKGSVKRYRIHCRLDNAKKVEVRLFNKSRPVHRLPTLAQTQPIGAGDYLTLVLDNEVVDHGFLSRAILLDEKAKRRFYRENLKDKDLAFLADYPQCYRAFNAIIIGGVDPTRIDSRRRDLLRRYVADGGVLVLYAGANAGKLKDPWIEDLFGTKIGPAAPIAENDLIPAAFGPDAAPQPAENKTGMIADLDPIQPDVQIVGHEKIIATRRKIGKGYAVVFAIDAQSHLLQTAPAFLELWRDIYAHNPVIDRFNFKDAGVLCHNLLPRLTGVTIQPRSSVFLYLGLYFLVAIVANWLFWDQMKRRELAWGFLIVFSIGFTAYAMIFGTVGRARATELDRIEVLHLPQGGGLADLHAIIGVLTARTTNLAADVTAKYALLDDVSLEALHATGYNQYRGGPMNFGDDQLRPFVLTLEPKLRIEEFHVMASVMRAIGVDGMLETPGGLEGELVHDDNGLAGKLVNRSGIKLPNPYLLYNGHIYPVKAVPDGFMVALSPSELKAPLDKKFMRADRVDSKPDAFKDFFIYRLFAEPDDDNPVMRMQSARGNPYFNLNQTSSLSSAYGPYLFGWTDRPAEPGLEFKRRPQIKIAHSLAVFDLTVKENVSLEQQPWRDLAVRIENVQAFQSDSQCGAFRRLEPPTTPDWTDNACRLFPNPDQNQAPVLIQARLNRLFSADGGEIVIDLYWNRNSNADLSLKASGDGGGAGALSLLEQTIIELEGDLVVKKSYRVVDPAALLDQATGAIEAELVIGSWIDETGKTLPQRGKPILLNALARQKTSAQDRTKGEWPSWR